MAFQIAGLQLLQLVQTLNIRQDFTTQMSYVDVALVTVFSQHKNNFFKSIIRPHLNKVFFCSTKSNNCGFSVIIIQRYLH